MSPTDTQIAEGKKFYWDGAAYTSADEASAARAAYERNGFDTCHVERDGVHRVFTRRVVRQTGDVTGN